MSKPQVWAFERPKGLWPVHVLFTLLFGYLLYFFIEQGREGEAMWPFAWIGGYWMCVMIHSIHKDRSKKESIL